ncbi:putative RNA-directed DNA polymerase, eukaryota, reverse transcriptase zinc-binding domain protein, partial [Tanacetum coccineum]
MDFIKESAIAPVGSEKIFVCVSEFEGQINSLFNGYMITSYLCGDYNDVNDISYSDEVSVGFSGEEDEEHGDDTGSDGNQEVVTNSVGPNGDPVLANSGGIKNSENSADMPSQQGSTLVMGHGVKDKTHLHRLELHATASQVDGDIQGAIFEYFQNPTPRLLGSHEVNTIINVCKDLGFDMVGKDLDVAQALGTGVNNCLQETMSNVDNHLTIQSMWGHSLFDYSVKKVDGKSGVESANIISVVMGDFNEVRSASERMGSHYCQRSARIFVVNSSLFCMFGHLSFSQESYTIPIVFILSKTMTLIASSMVISGLFLTLKITELKHSLKVDFEKAKKHKKKLLLFKVDFEKAFDTLNWSFLDSIMSQMGFGVKWRSWIQVCLNSAYASVLVNGSPTKEFKIQRGLRQGDPLSLFLFILAIEALNVAFLEARYKNIFIGVEVGRDKVPIS